MSCHLHQVPICTIVYEPSLRKWSRVTSLERNMAWRLNKAATVWFLRTVGELFFSFLVFLITWEQGHSTPQAAAADMAFGLSGSCSCCWEGEIFIFPSSPPSMEAHAQRATMSWAWTSVRPNTATAQLISWRRTHLTPAALLLTPFIFIFIFPLHFLFPLLFL